MFYILCRFHRNTFSSEDIKPLSDALLLLVSPCNLVSFLFNDMLSLLCCQVTPAPCPLSWSWTKRCVSMKSTKTRSSLFTVSLTAFSTGCIYTRKHTPSGFKSQHVFVSRMWYNSLQALCQ